ncbi:MAG: site-specific integrase [Actinobacteria bacterium]|nr:site-specific integrase [Actinomycetota bacterium]
MSNGNRRHPGITARPTKKHGTVYEVRFRQPDGREISRTFRTLSAAKSWQVEQHRARDKGLWTDYRLGRTTFCAWSAEWLRSNPAKRERTIYRDQQVLAVVLKDWSNRPMSSITPEDCRRLVGRWMAHGYSGSTIRRMAAVVKAVLNSAVDADLVGRSPWRGVKLPQVLTASKEPLNPSAVLSLAREVGQEASLVVLTAALCGLRFGECAGLRIGDVDVKQRTLSVRHSVSELAGRVVVSPPKSRASERTLLMPVTLSELLATHIAHRCPVATSDDWLFTSPSGGPLRYGNFRNRVFAPACKRLGLEDVTFHDLRKFNATLMVTGGVDIKTAQSRLGHSDPRLTLAVYAQATTESQRSAARVIDVGMTDALVTKNGVSGISRGVSA